MFIELIATVFAGLASAGLAMLVNTITGRRLPRWIVPIAAGAGMLALTISNEYIWYDRTADELPEGITVALTVEESSWVRPWTKIWPYTKRFVAVDEGTARTHDNQPDQTLVNLFFFGRWSPVSRAPMLFDCAGDRSALLIDGAEFSDDGSVPSAEWEPRAPDDPIMGVACSG